MNKSLKSLLTKKITPVYLITAVAVLVGLPYALWALTQDGMQSLGGAMLLFSVLVMLTAFVFDRLLASFLRYEILFGIEILLLIGLYAHRRLSDPVFYVRSTEEINYFVIVDGICENFTSKFARNHFFDRSLDLERNGQVLFINFAGSERFRVVPDIVNWQDIASSGFRDTLQGTVYSIEVYRPYVPGVEPDREEITALVRAEIGSMEGCD